MNENFLSSFGISAEEDRIDFNRETGEFKLYGKAEIGSQAYRMLEEVYSMQALKDKMNKGELKKEDIHEVLKLLEKILNTDIPNVQSSIKDIEDFLPNPVFSAEDKFFIITPITASDTTGHIEKTLFGTELERILYVGRQTSTFQLVL